MGKDSSVPLMHHNPSYLGSKNPDSDFPKETHPKASWHLAIFFACRGDVAVLKTHLIKSPNQMGWLYWPFTAINVD